MTITKAKSTGMSLDFICEPLPIVLLSTAQISQHIKYHATWAPGQGLKLKPQRL